MPVVATPTERPRQRPPALGTQLRPGATTGIGSLPHRSVHEAASFALCKYELPAIPSLPRRSPAEGMIAQAVVGINGVARDISERLRLERELSRSEARFRFLGRRRRQFRLFSPGGRALVLGDGCGALGVPEFFERTVEVFRRTQVTLEQELDGAFARFTAFAHSSTPAWRTTHEREMK